MSYSEQISNMGSINKIKRFRELKYGLKIKIEGFGIY
jgi:hypothetical protein